MGSKEVAEIGAAATDYLRLFGLVATGWMWVRMASAARAKAAKSDGDAARYEAKVATARFFVAKLLPQADALASQIAGGAGPVMALDPANL